MSSSTPLTVFNLASLPLSVLASALAPFLATTDLLAVSSCSRDTRRLLLSPPVWRHRVFRSFPPFAFSSSSSTPTLLSWCDAVQLVDRPSPFSSFRKWGASALPCSSLVLFPHLRHALMRPIQEPSLAAAVTSLASMRHLTRLSLAGYGLLSKDDLQLLTTLPALASLEVSQLHFPLGDEESLRDWQALTVGQQSGGGGEWNAEDEAAKGEQQEELEGELDEHSRGDEVEWGEEDQQATQDSDDDLFTDDADNPDLPLHHSALLLLFHQLAAMPSLVRLQLEHCDITPFVMDHMPVWPHLRCLSLEHNRSLKAYTFHGVAARFPSLTSLTTTDSCSDAVIAQLVRLPLLEELRFPYYGRACKQSRLGVQTSVRGFRALSEARSLRSVYYSPSEGEEGRLPSCTSLGYVLRMEQLTRLTLPATWFLDGDAGWLPLLTQHRFAHLRCLELIEQSDSNCGGTWYVCPQSDSSLMPLIKHADCIVPGREERQAKRLAMRMAGRPQPPDHELDGEEDDRETAEKDTGEGDHSEAEEEEAEPASPDETAIAVGHDAEEDALKVVDCSNMASLIPEGNAANFPALECLALPYGHYDQVSAWTQAQLRRSYEYEVVAEWEAEQSTLGEAELLKTVP